MAAEFSPSTATATGSDSGTGKATAVARAAAGLDVGITWHTDEGGAKATAEEFRALGRCPEIVHLDAPRLDECGEVAEQLADRLGGVDVFVNISGPGDSALLVNRTLEQWRTVVTTDPDGAFVCMKRAARRMSHGRTGGRIIALTSVHEHQPRVGSADYATAKHGLGGVMKTLDQPYFAGSGVTSACNYELAYSEEQPLHASGISSTPEDVRILPGSRPTAPINQGAL